MQNRIRVRMQEKGSDFRRGLTLDLIEKSISEFKKQFTGPSQYFHEKSIELARSTGDFLSPLHIERIYAVLPAWGMHRMGKDVKAKVPMFNESEASILMNKDALETLREKNITDDDLKEVLDHQLIKIFSEIKGSESNSILVANSKVLAHILPSLVPPIDRAYTLKFFGITAIPGPLNEQKQLFSDLVLEMALIARKVKDCGYARFDLPKVVDNLIIRHVIRRM